MIEQRFPHRGRPKDQMVISLSGVLGRAAETCKRSRNSKHLEYDLCLLEKHINTMRRAKNDAEALEFLDKFLGLWVEQ